MAHLALECGVWPLDAACGPWMRHRSVGCGMWPLEAASNGWMRHRTVRCRHVTPRERQVSVGGGESKRGQECSVENSKGRKDQEVVRDGHEHQLAQLRGLRARGDGDALATLH